MSDFLKKISLYDILAMLIPGGAIYIFLLLTLGIGLNIDENKIDPTLGWIASLAISYLLGLINHTITSCLWLPFRNNYQMIKWANVKYGKTKYISKDIDKSKSPCRLYCTYLACCVGIAICAFVVNKVNREISLPILLTILCVIILFFCLIVSHKFCTKGSDQDGKEDKENVRYYEKYYYVATHSYRKDVSIIEGQVAFMQSLLIPLSCFLLLPACKYKILFGEDWENCTCMVKIILSIVMFLLVLAIFSRQMKIYQCVFEDYEFLPREQNEKSKPKAEENPKTNSQQNQATS